MLQIITLILSKIESLISKNRDYYKTFWITNYPAYPVHLGAYNSVYIRI